MIAIAELARVAGSGVAAAGGEEPVQGAMPLLPIQRWFFELPLPVAAHWNQSLLLRAESGEIDAELGRWWTDFLNAEGDVRAEMLLPQKPDEAKKRRRRKRKPAAAKAPVASD